MLKASERGWPDGIVNIRCLSYSKSLALATPLKSISRKMWNLIPYIWRYSQSVHLKHTNKCWHKGWMTTWTNPCPDNELFWQIYPTTEILKTKVTFGNAFCANTPRLSLKGKAWQDCCVFKTNIGYPMAVLSLIILKGYWESQTYMGWNQHPCSCHFM